MAKLYIYTVFHFNLAFSSIPQEHYPSVIDTCYWPFVELLERFPEIFLGFEFTGDTLQKIHKIDSSLVDKLKQLNRNKRCEIIASSLSQAVFPLIPVEVNKRNLEAGLEVYKNLLDTVPKTVYVNEQTFSNGLTALYEEAGFKNIIMEYENSRLFNNLDLEDKHFSHKIGSLNLVWNSSINFQKFQRYAFGTLDIDSYKAFIASHCSCSEDRAFILYGSDAEVFDYKPGNYDSRFRKSPYDEMHRISELFAFISAQTDYKTVGPSYIADNLNTCKSMIPGTPENPLVCKKQPKYNPVRWAVSGRDDTRMNTECMNLYQRIKRLKNLCFPVKDSIMDTLCLLWGSDYRTRTTESKLSEFYNLLGRLDQEVSRKEKDCLGTFKIKEDFIIINPDICEWPDGESFSFNISFGKGRFYGKRLGVRVNGELCLSQLEDAEYYRDGSIRNCKLVMEVPFIKPGGCIEGKFTNLDIQDMEADLPLGYSFKTDTVDIHLSEIKKGTIDRLKFCSLSEKPAAGLIPHGYFSDIRYSADYFTGHTIIRDRSLKQITDLDSGDMHVDPGGPLRMAVKVKTGGEFGELWKVFYIYRHEYRVDINYYFKINDISPVFFRTGIITFNPEFFNYKDLFYSTTNGGIEEKYPLYGRTFDQSEQVSLDVSSSGCLGATQGWVDFSDGSNGILINRSNGGLYSVPMLSLREIDKKPLLRLFHSLSETDDTGSIFWRGNGSFGLSIYGYKKAAREETIKRVQKINTGLIMLQNRES